MKNTRILGSSICYAVTLKVSNLIPAYGIYTSRHMISLLPMSVVACSAHGVVFILGSTPTFMIIGTDL